MDNMFFLACRCDIEWVSSNIGAATSKDEQVGVAATVTVPSRKVAYRFEFDELSKQIESSLGGK